MCTNPLHASAIVLSFELAAERCEDLTPFVYERLFQRRPELRKLFRENPRIVQGEMLSLTIEGVLDFIGPRYFSHFWIANEGVRHEANIDRDTFISFFEVLADTLRDAIGNDWTRDMSTAWKDLIAEIARYVQEGNK